MTKKQLAFISFFAFFWFIGFLAFDYRINHFSQNSDAKADAIVILTGGRNRLSAAVKLLNAKKAEKMFISGVDKAISIKELQKRKDVEIFSSENITLDKKSTNTVENARETSQWIKDNHIRSIYLVTSNYHMPRSMVEFHYYSPKLEIISYPVFSDKVERKWWKSWHSFKLLTGEYNKFLYVLVRDSLIVRKEK